MPNSASAKKDLRQNQTRRLQNKMVRSRLRKQLSKVREKVNAGDFEGAEAEFRIAVKKLDQAGAKHLIHKNAADRSKSRMSNMIKKAKLAAA
jgi:small subunit ribosomal protein S20